MLVTLTYILYSLFFCPFSVLSWQNSVRDCLSFFPLTSTQASTCCWRKLFYYFYLVNLHLLSSQCRFHISSLCKLFTLFFPSHVYQGISLPTTNFLKDLPVSPPTLGCLLLPPFSQNYSEVTDDFHIAKSKWHLSSLSLSEFLIPLGIQYNWPLWDTLFFWLGF